MYAKFYLERTYNRIEFWNVGKKLNVLSKERYYTRNLLARTTKVNYNHSSDFCLKFPFSTGVLGVDQQ